MKNYWSYIGATLLLMTGSAQAQPPQIPELIYAENFDDGVTWIGIGEGTKVSTAQEEENVHQGRGALRFDYEVKPKQSGALIGPLAPGTLSTLQSVRFWIKADHDTSMMLALQEQGGGRFSTVFSLTKNQWQKVEVSPSDFILEDGVGDPEDANGKLDPDKLEGFSLTDFSQIFAQLVDENALTKLLGIETGSRTFYLDSVEFSRKPLPAAEAPAEAVKLDVFARPQISWISVGGVALQRTAEENALQASYRHGAGRLSGLFKPLPRGVLAGKESLRLEVVSQRPEVVSQRPALLIFQLEEAGGGKYDYTLLVSGNAATTPVNAVFNNFKPSDDSKDDNGKLDLEKVKQLAVMDATGLFTQEQGENTLWLKGLRAE